MICSELQALLGKENVKKNEPMSLHTTFRIGGPCKAYVTPESLLKLEEAIALLEKRKEPYFVLGRGSNLLVSDSGFRGIVLSMREHIRRISTEGNRITAEGGALLSDVAKEALKHGLCGFEFASGIPGTVGGALTMNAGAYGFELKDRLHSVLVYFHGGEIREVSKEELKLSYRSSALQENHGIVLQAELEFEKDDPNEIRRRMERFNEMRREKQPLEFGSAGSVFKRPEGHFAGQLIEEAGLKGYRSGDAEVSEKHAGFIVNRGQATAGDVDRVVRHVIKEVERHSGITLEPEIQYLGEF